MVQKAAVRPYPRQGYAPRAVLASSSSTQLPFMQMASELHCQHFVTPVRVTTEMNPLHEEDVWPLLRWKEPTC